MGAGGVEGSVGEAGGGVEGGEGGYGEVGSDDDVVGAEDGGVGGEGVESLRGDVDGYAGVEFADFWGGGFGSGFANVGGGDEELSAEIVLGDDVVVDES